MPGDAGEPAADEPTQVRVKEAGHPPARRLSLPVLVLVLIVLAAVIALGYAAATGLL